MKKLYPSQIVITSNAESELFQFRLRFDDSSPPLEFYVAETSIAGLIVGLRDAQQRYKIAKALLVQKRKPRLVKKDDV